MEEELLLEAIRRALSMPRGRVAMLLRLSLLAPPLPRPYHRRIARAILEDTAAQHRGEVFEIGCGDIVLLCHAAAPARTAETAILTPSALPHTLARLFRVDLPSTQPLTAFWTLERDGPALLAYATEQASAARQAVDCAAEGS